MTTDKLIHFRLFAPGHFRQLPALASRLQTHEDPVSEMVWNRLTSQTRQVLATPETDPEETEAALIEDFNRLLRGESLHDPQRFEKVKLSERTQAVLSASPHGDELIVLNRLLLEDAYPAEIARSLHVEVQDLRLSYGTKEVIHGISFEIHRNEIIGVIGPAQSGKTSLLRCINRTVDFTPGANVSGTVRVDGQNVRQVKDVFELRRKIGMVAPLPVGLPLSIYDNVAFAPRCAGMTNRSELDGLVEKCLRQAALWDEVKDRLGSLGTKLSGGQQQRLTIARALSHQPEILCLDEFSIAIDPVTTMRIEDVLKELRAEMTIILVTNLTQQARRLANRTMFLWNGDIIELDGNDVIFSDHPKDRRTYEYVMGIFG